MTKPAFGTSQQIGHLGKVAFDRIKPDSWVTEGEPVQGGDFGYDISMWLTSLGRVQGRFSVQVKGELDAKPTMGSDPQFTVQLTPKQANIYVQDGNPLMVVHAALVSADSSAGATVRFAWIDEELQRRLNGRLEFDETDPESMTFHIPAANVLTIGVDISEYLQKYWTFNRQAHKLRTLSGGAALGTLAALPPQAVERVGQVEPGSLARMLARADFASDTPWIATSHPLASDLRRLADLTSAGDLSEARRAADKVSGMLEGAEVDVLAEFAFQSGRLAQLDGNSEEALEHFFNANSLKSGTPRYLAAFIESALLKSYKEKDAFELDPDLLNQAAKSEHAAVLFQRVRIATLQGDYAEANRLVGMLTGAEQAKARILSLLIRQLWSDAAREAMHALEHGGFSEAECCFIAVLRAVAELNRFLNGRNEVAPGGPPEIDIEAALRLRAAVSEALSLARKRHWPANSELLLDGSLVVALAFGENEQLLEDIRDFARERPQLGRVQETLEKIAVSAGRRDLAIEAINRRSNADPDSWPRLVLLLAEEGQFERSIQLAVDKLLPLPHSHFVDAAVLAAVGSAQRTGASEEAALRSYLASDGADEGVRALLLYLDSGRRTAQDDDASLDVLWKAAIGDETGFLDDNLMLYLKPSRPADVDRIIELVGRIRRRRGLNQMEAEKAAASLLERNRFEEVIELGERELRRFDRSENLGVVLALAYERSGQAEAASRVLSRFEDSARLDMLHARTQMHFRVGEPELAVKLVQRALGRAKTPEDRFHFERLLVGLHSRDDPETYLDAVWRFGSQVDQAIEEQEGAFLVHFALASAPLLAVDPARIESFHRRIDAFARRFPESKIFRVGQFPENATGEEMLKTLRSMSGVTEEAERARRELVAFGERVGSQIPFVLRPGGIAPYASDVLRLFAVTVRGVFRGESAKLSIAPTGSSQRSLPPIVDLVTVLALAELDLFDALFELWNGIAIPKPTLEHLAHLRLTDVGSSGDERLETVRNALRNHKHQIIQPNHLGDDAFPGSEFSVIARELATGTYQYLSVDGAAAAVIGDEQVRLSIWTLIDWLQAEKIVDAGRASVSRLQLAAWNTVGCVLSANDVSSGIAADPDSAAVSEKPLSRSVSAFLSLADENAIGAAVAELVSIPAAVEGLRAFVGSIFRDRMWRSGSRSAEQVAVMIANEACGHLIRRSNRIAMMEMVWSVVREGYRSWIADELRLRNYVADVVAVSTFEGSKRVGLAFAGEESEYRELMFLVARTGTQERDELNKRYFDASVRLSNG